MVNQWNWKMLTVAGMAAAMFFAAGSCSADKPVDTKAVSIAEVLKELADLKTQIAQLNKRVETIESRLAGFEFRKPQNDSSPLRFPIEVERAMMGDAIYQQGIPVPPKR